MLCNSFWETLTLPKRRCQVGLKEDSLKITSRKITRLCPKITRVSCKVVWVISLQGITSSQVVSLTLIITTRMTPEAWTRETRRPWISSMLKNSRTRTMTQTGDHRLKKEAPRGPQACSPRIRALPAPLMIVQAALGSAGTQTRTATDTIRLISISSNSLPHPHPTGILIRTRWWRWWWWVPLMTRNSNADAWI